jgi:hypothetical protein
VYNLTDDFSMLLWLAYSSADEGTQSGVTNGRAIPHPVFQDDSNYSRGMTFLEIKIVQPSVGIFENI